MLLIEISGADLSEVGYFKTELYFIICLPTHYWNYTTVVY